MPLTGWGCTNLFKNFSENSLKGDLQNDTNDNPTLFSLVNAFNTAETAISFLMHFQGKDYHWYTRIQLIMTAISFLMHFWGHEPLKQQFSQQILANPDHRPFSFLMVFWGKNHGMIFILTTDSKQTCEQQRDKKKKITV